MVSDSALYCLLWNLISKLQHWYGWLCWFRLVVCGTFEWHTASKQFHLLVLVCTKQSICWQKVGFRKVLLASLASSHHHLKSYLQLAADFHWVLFHALLSFALYLIPSLKPFSFFILFVSCLSFCFLSFQYLPFPHKSSCFSGLTCNFLWLFNLSLICYSSFHFLLLTYPLSL